MRSPVIGPLLGFSYSVGDASVPLPSPGGTVSISPVAAGSAGSTRVTLSNTGTAAAVSGIDVAGKTGTAEISNGINQAWFIGFAPANDPKIAIACTVERTSGFGGPTCGPIFKSVAEAILRGSGGSGG